MYTIRTDCSPQVQNIECVQRKLEYDPILMRAAVFDIECMDFKTGGILKYLICTSILPLDEDEPYTIELMFEDAGDDSRLMTELIEELVKFDILIGHNIAAFDFNWIYSRLMYHGLPSPPKRWLYYDTYQAAKRMAIKAERKSLGFLGDYFGIDVDKTAVLPVAWQRVASRKQEEFNAGMQEIVMHCELDVKLNRQLFWALWPRDRSATNLPFTRKW
jgi:uncharacterized protein YprB with RNaseH-like and TPR domain